MADVRLERAIEVYWQKHYGHLWWHSPGVTDFQKKRPTDHVVMLDMLMKQQQDLANVCAALEHQIERWRGELRQTEQVLGQALGYKEYFGDPRFPRASIEDGIYCEGKSVPVLAEEAHTLLVELREFLQTQGYGKTG